MAGPRWELADVFRRYGAAFRQACGAGLSRQQRRVIRAIEACRTAALGGHVDTCDRCEYRAVSYNSCRNRHCPKCQGSACTAWVAERERELLPVPYFHVVFTVPAAIADLAIQNKRTVYGILFKTTAATLLTIAKDPKHLGAHIGFLAILHTWGRNLLHHPHLHCVVPGGGLSLDRQRWVPSRPGFFLPVHVLSSLFRRLFLTELEGAFHRDQLHFFGSLAPLRDPASFATFLAAARALDWVVYVKPPFAGPEVVLRYLGRYTHRVALSNDRILSIDDGKVSFRFKDYRDGDRVKTMTLDASEFLRRFLLHVLPGRFHRIRHFGLLGNPRRAENLALCRRLLVSPATLSVAPAPDQTTLPAPPPLPAPCPSCREGSLVRSEIVPAARALPPPPGLRPAPSASIALDSS